MVVHTFVIKILLLRLVYLCLMEVLDNRTLYNKFSSHDPPPPPHPPGSESGRKRKHLCLMEVLDNETLCTELSSHDSPPPPRSELGRKRKQTCKVAAQLCALASTKAGRTTLQIAMEASIGVDGDRTDMDESMEGIEGQIVSSINPGSYPGCQKLVALKQEDPEFADVKSKLLGGLGSIGEDSCTITGIYRDCSSTGQARQQSFERQEDITKQARGNANVRYAWHGTSKTGVSGIFLHGFGQPRTPKNGSAYGVGVYLAPENYAHVSAVYADNDENEEQHIVLCQVILGASELVKPGSEQFHPSSEHVDTGVDDLLAPKRLIVWSTHMNTHILPLYAISFKLPLRWHERMADLRVKQRGFHDLPVKRVHTKNETLWRTDGWHVEAPKCARLGNRPTSACLSFPNLFTLLQPHLALKNLQFLQKLYFAFKAGRFSREKLIVSFRHVVGDARLVDAIGQLQGYQVTQERKFESLLSVSEMNANVLSSVPNA